MAHGLIASMSIVAGSVGMLRTAWEDFESGEREMLLAKAAEHARHVAAALTDLVRGLPAEVISQLDHLRDE